MMRINKYISSCGAASRREADEMIRAGRVTVDGHTAEFGEQVSDESTILLDGRRLFPKRKKTYLVMNKPRGIVCTFEKREKDNLMDYLNYPVRVTYAGRLDKYSEGLLILTDDGDLIDLMMRARNAHEKEYAVRLTKEYPDDLLDKLREGVYLEELDTTTRPCRAWRTGKDSFRIVLTQGLNRQIRRMCGEFGYKVAFLRRERILNLKLGDLKPGEFRELTEEEQKTLLAAVTEENG